MFIEHIPRAECLHSLQDTAAATIDDSTSRASNRCYIAYTVFVYGHIQSVGVTAYRIYNNVHIVKLKRWGQMLRISICNSMIWSAIWELIARVRFVISRGEAE